VTPSASGGAEIRVRLQPRASADAIAGERGGTLVVRVTAPPVAGRANEALRALIAKQARVAKGRVEIVRGSPRRDKVVRVAGMSQRDLRAALAP
jgi:uncharacterized protein (TIGR00251 family)